ncbi:SIMPL domain-containing protein [Sphingomonas endolithica]|uniref:SIMPL domain-containing protein n=1 Tax=Sphingomonas endolithica TaxID=2972485 RepID=UPI0021AF57F4|nr:SIMPL domain-containing protein [Sphingomonas sp. ZFBP2030]
MRLVLLPGLAFPLILSLAACSPGKHGPHDLDRDETLLQVSATGRAEAHPDEARFSAGVSSIGVDAAAATQANNARMNAVIAALTALGVAKEDIQTKQLTVARLDWGPNKRKFEANNVVEVRMRVVDKAGAAIAATTQAGANVLSGPDLRVSDDSVVNGAAYAAAYKAARARADALAAAANLKVVRILSIRDGSTSAPSPVADMAYEAPRQAAPAPPPVLAGTDTTIAAVSIDAVLGPR